MMHPNSEVLLNDQIKGWEEEDEPTPYTSNYLKPFQPNLPHPLLTKIESNTLKLLISQRPKIPKKIASPQPEMHQKYEISKVYEPWAISNDKQTLLRFLCSSHEHKIPHQSKFPQKNEKINLESEVKDKKGKQLTVKDLPSLIKEHRKHEKQFGDLFQGQKKQKKSRRKYFAKKVFEQPLIQTDLTKKRFRQASKIQLLNNLWTTNHQPNEEHPMHRLGTEIPIKRIKKFPLYFRQTAFLENKKQQQKKPQSLLSTAQPHQRKLICKSQFFPPPSPSEPTPQFTDDNIFSSKIIRA